MVPAGTGSLKHSVIMKTASITFECLVKSQKEINRIVARIYNNFNVVGASVKVSQNIPEPYKRDCYEFYDNGQVFGGNGENFDDYQLIGFHKEIINPKEPDTEINEYGAYKVFDHGNQPFFEPH